MKEVMGQVLAFHAKYGFAVGQKVEPQPSLWSVAQSLAAEASWLGINMGENIAKQRAHLVIEEAAELLKAMTTGDEMELLDALCDLVYVTVGTAVAFGMPLPAGFDEVCRSNMTKTQEQDRPGHPGKGAGYSPPDLKRILEEDQSNGVIDG